MREEEKNRSSQDSSIKRFFKKRWVFPAVYIASAAIILTGVLWYQTSDNANDKINNSATDLSGKKINEEPAVEVNRLMENFIMPVGNPDEAVIKMPFYEYDGKKAEQEAALVFYNNAYHPNTGIDITTKDGKTFEVVAALSGTVTEVTEDALLGNVIEIEHDKGIVTQYQSISDIMIEVGDSVEQGQTLAKAGKSLYNEEAGTHLHFEIRKDNTPVNPEKYINKPLSALQEVKTVDESNVGEGDSAGDVSDEKEAQSNEKDAKSDKETTGEEGTEKSAEDKETSDGNKSSDDKNATDDKDDAESDEDEDDEEAQEKGKDADSNSKNDKTSKSESLNA